MALAQFSSTLKSDLRKSKISFREKVFADLLIIGWIEFDAYIASGLFNELYSLKVNEVNMRKLLNENTSFISYLNSRTKSVHNSFSNGNNVSEDVSPSSISDVNYRDKDAIIDALSIEAQTLKGKDKVDALMKIADLQQMKKEEIVDDRKVVHYYLPLTCNNCKLFLDRS